MKRGNYKKFYEMAGQKKNEGICIYNYDKGIKGEYEKYSVEHFK